MADEKRATCSGDGVIIPDAIWQGRGTASDYKLRIVDCRRDGRIICERIAIPGGEEEFKRKFPFGRPELTCTDWQLRSAYEPTGDWDFGEPLPELDDDADAAPLVEGEVPF